MICCCWWISVLQTNWWTGREQKEKFFLVCDDDLLLQTDVRPSNKLMDRSRSEGDAHLFLLLRWWSVAASHLSRLSKLNKIFHNQKCSTASTLMIDLLVVIDVRPFNKFSQCFITKRVTFLNTAQWSNLISNCVCASTKIVIFSSDTKPSAYDNCQWF